MCANSSLILHDRVYDMLHLLPMLFEWWRKEILLPIDRDVVPIILKKLDDETLNNLLLAKVESVMSRNILAKRENTAECWSCENRHRLYNANGELQSEVVGFVCRCTPPIVLSFDIDYIREDR